MKNLSLEDGAKKRILSTIWDFLHTNKWLDSDDFSLELSDKLFEILQKYDLSPDNTLKMLNGTRTTFFRINKISKRKFAEMLISDVGNKLKKILLDSRLKISLSQLNPIRILFLTANPKDTVGLRLDEEVREIENKILLAQKKDQILLVKKGAVRIGDLQFYLSQENPTIVHFSGHGTSDGKIVLEDNQGNARTVPPKALARAFGVLRDNIRCVVLNACFSLEQANAISQHIECVVGMSTSISDKAAIAFSTAFYLGIAGEKSVKNAFDQGITELMLWGIPEENIPKLLVRKNVNPSKVFLFGNRKLEK